MLLRAKAGEVTQLILYGEHFAIEEPPDSTPDAQLTQDPYGDYHGPDVKEGESFWDKAPANAFDPRCPRLTRDKNRPFRAVLLHSDIIEQVSWIRVASHNGQLYHNTWPLFQTQATFHLAGCQTCG